MHDPGPVRGGGPGLAVSEKALAFRVGVQLVAGVRQSGQRVHRGGGEAPEFTEGDRLEKKNSTRGRSRVSQVAMELGA